MPARSLLTFIMLCVSLLGCSPQKTPLTSHQHAAKGSYAADMSADGRYSIVSATGTEMLVWDNHNNKLAYRWRQNGGANNPVFIVRAAAQGNAVITAARTDFAVWRLSDGQNLGYYQIDTNDSIRDAAISAEGRYALIGQGSGKVVHIDLQTGRRLEFLAHSERINSVDLSANGKYALTGGNDYSAYLWDTQSAQVINRFTHGSRVTMVRFAPNGEFAFTADSGRQANIWRIPQGDLFQSLRFFARQNVFSSVRFANNNQWLLTGSPARQLSVWSVSSGEELARYQVSPKADSRPASAVVYAAALDKSGNIQSESSSGLAELWPPPTSNN